MHCAALLGRFTLGGRLNSWTDARAQVIITVLYAHICWWFVPVMLYLSEIITLFWSWPCRALWEICPAESLHWSIATWRARTCRRSHLKVGACSGRGGGHIEAITFILGKRSQCNTCGLFYIQGAGKDSLKLEQTCKIDRDYQQPFRKMDMQDADLHLCLKVDKKALKIT